MDNLKSLQHTMPILPLLEVVTLTERALHYGTGDKLILGKEIGH